MGREGRGGLWEAGRRREGRAGGDWEEKGGREWRGRPRGGAGIERRRKRASGRWEDKG